MSLIHFMSIMIFLIMKGVNLSSGFLFCNLFLKYYCVYLILILLK